MNAIIGMTELVLDSHLEHNQRDYLQKILYSSRMLLDIINDLLDLSKIEAGKLQLEKIDFDLYSLLNNLHGLLAIQAENKGLRCRYVVDDNVPQYLKGDPLRLGQILTNLLSNAIKFSFHGEVIVSVSYLQNIESGVLLHFSVQDSGIGLSTTEKERLFNAFYQADSSITRIYGGTGLGLTISRQLVEMMGGDIKVDSQPGIGSTFSFCAEFELAEKFSSSHNDLSNEGLPAVRMEHLDSIAGSRILLVEDNLFNREVARSFLQQSHFIVDSVTNGKDAVLGVQQNFFDAVLMDIQMPEMDGYEATIKIREDQKNQYLPIIAMTAYSTVGEREKCLASGMNDYISKPISKRYLFSKLLQWITPKPTQQRREQDHSHLSTDILSRELPNTFSRELPEVYTLPKSLPGLDIAKALRRLEIDAAFYIDLLDEMTREFGDACEQMQTYLPNSQIDNALMLLHTLKAMAGYLGANTLYLLTTDLESQLQHPKTKGVDWNGQLQNTDPQLNSSEQELGRLFGKWQKAMQEVLQSINMLKHSIVEYQSEEVLDSTTVCKDEIARELRNLQDAIKHSRFLSKFKLLQAKRLCGSPNNEEQWRNLIAEITRFDYEKAMYSLQQIAQSWDIVI
jgi:CheY-like chemotaxis protein/two-component sensor histidine kinase